MEHGFLVFGVFFFFLESYQIRKYMCLSFSEYNIAEFISPTFCVYEY